MWTLIVCINSHRVNIPLLKISRNSPISTKSLYLFGQNLSDVLDLILYQPDADFSGIKSHNLFPLSVVTKLLFCNISISLVKDALYNTLSWLFRSKAPIKMYLKFKLNFSERSISK